MAELTYILGAGASYQSMPIVKTFPSRFDEFIGSMRHSPNLKKIHQNRFDKLITDIYYFGNEIKSHQSFDTYFKKLFHTNSHKMILNAKKILNLYFLWEHYQPSIDFAPKTDHLGNDLPYERKEGSFIKGSLIDKRYDALIAGIIKPVKGKIELFKKVNFISWNYDLNLFCSIKNFINPDLFINPLIESLSQQSNNTWDFDNGIKVINMNGHFYSSWLYNLEMFNSDHFYSILDSHINKGDFSIETSISDKDAEKINFAWEKGLNLNENSVLLAAKEAIEKSGTIVVIGYTFPLYNRLVDLEYFKKLGARNIYIQDPNAIDIKSQIVNDFSIVDYDTRGIGTKIKTITNCDSFFVPSNIYKPKIN